MHTLRAQLKVDFTWEEKRDMVGTLVLGIRVDGPDQSLVTYAFDSNAPQHTLCNVATDFFVDFFTTASAAYKRRVAGVYARQAIAAAVRRAEG